MERWLSQRLATEFGVWANARFPFPRAFIDELLDAEPAAATRGPSRGKPSPGRSPTLLAGGARLPGAEALASYLATEDEDVARFELGSARSPTSSINTRSTDRSSCCAWERGAGRGWQPDLWRAMVRPSRVGSHRGACGAISRGETVPDRHAGARFHFRGVGAAAHLRAVARPCGSRPRSARVPAEPLRRSSARAPARRLARLARPRFRENSPRGGARRRAPRSVRRRQRRRTMLDFVANGSSRRAARERRVRRRRRASSRAWKIRRSSCTRATRRCARSRCFAISSSLRSKKTRHSSRGT